MTACHSRIPSTFSSAVPTLTIPGPTLGLFFCPQMPRMTNLVKTWPVVKPRPKNRHVK